MNPLSLLYLRACALGRFQCAGVSHVSTLHALSHGRWVSEGRFHFQADPPRPSQPALNEVRPLRHLGARYERLFTSAIERDNREHEARLRRIRGR